MNRRKFIWLTLGTTAAGFAFQRCADGDVALRPEFLHSVLGTAQIKDIGKAYLQQFPGESDKIKLAALLEDGDSSATGEFFITKTREDFRDGRIVILNGWILSLTEARQSALYYLNS